MYALLLTFFLLALTVSFLCSLWEAVLLSITPSYAQIKQREGSRIGHHLRDFKDNVDRPLAAILSLNTIAHTVGAVGVGNQATVIWAQSHPLVTGVAVPVVMTLAILVLSELIPKTLGANYWRELVPFTVASLRLTIALLAPLVWFAQFITRALKKDKSKSIFSRNDFLALAEIGAQHGVFEQLESQIIANLLRFSSVRAADIMTPRTVVKTASEACPIKDFLDANRDIRFTRIPVYEADSKDQITGYVRKDEMMARLIAGRGADPVRVIRREILVIDEILPLSDLFGRFLERRESIALVVDGFGGMAGIVTMEDIVETLLGLEIVDELDATVDMQALARQSWQQRARRLGLLDDQVTPAGKTGAAPDD